MDIATKEALVQWAEQARELVYLSTHDDGDIVLACKISEIADLVKAAADHVAGIRRENKRPEAAIAVARGYAEAAAAVSKTA